MSAARSSHASSVSAPAPGRRCTWWARRPSEEAGSCFDREIGAYRRPVDADAPVDREEP